LAERCSVGFEQGGRRAGNCHRLCYLTEAQLDVRAARLRDAKINLFDNIILKSRGLY
jgi:hypothetical protein